MIYTSYFAKLKKLPSNYIPIAICGKSPNWYKGLQYKKLAPKYDFFMKWKENHDNDYYIKCFNEQVLKDKNPYQVVQELYNLLDKDTINLLSLSNCPFWENQQIHLVLICYEKPEDFCHRTLVSKWFKQNNIKCEELIL